MGRAHKRSSASDYQKLFFLVTALLNISLEVKITLPFYTLKIWTINSCQMSGEDKSEGMGKPDEAGMKTGFIGVLAVGLMIGIIIGVAVGAFCFPQAQSQGFSAGSVLTPEKAGVRAIDFITNYAVAPGVDVELINVTAVEDANLYKMAVNISSMRGTQTAESYMTKDGKLLFPSGIDIEEFEETIEQQKRKEKNRTRE